MLETVAERRIHNGWGVESVEGYDLLIAPADCSFLGRSGWLFVGDKVYSVIVVDCEADAHKGQMAARGLLADQNKSELASQYAWLVLQDIK